MRAGLTLCSAAISTVTASICRPKAAAAAEEEAAVAAATGEPGAGLLPPCVLAHRSSYGGLTYQLHYRVQPVA